MPAHERRPDQPLDAYLCRILLGLCRAAGGELRLKESLVEVDTRTLLVRDYDPATGELIFRIGSRYAEPIWVDPVQSAWTIPFAERARELGLDEVVRHRIPSDEDLAEKERLRDLTRKHTRVAPAPTS